jgi:hypothetical protein
LLDGNGFRANPVAAMVHDTVPIFDWLLRVIDVMDTVAGRVAGHYVAGI